MSFPGAISKAGCAAGRSCGGARAAPSWARSTKPAPPCVMLNPGASAHEGNGDQPRGSDDARGGR